jgi:hypothetical protein
MGDIEGPPPEVPPSPDVIEAEMLAAAKRQGCTCEAEVWLPVPGAQRSPLDAFVRHQPDCALTPR